MLTTNVSRVIKAREAVSFTSVTKVLVKLNRQTKILIMVELVQSPETTREEIRISSQRWRNTAALHLIEADLVRQANDLMDCSDPQRSWQEKVCAADPQHYRAVIVPSCKLPYCPMCARARAAEVARDYEPIVQDALNASPDDYELRHIVLTTPYHVMHKDMDRIAGDIWNKTIYCLEMLFGLRQRHWSLFDFGLLGGYEYGEGSHLLHIHLLVLCPWVDKIRLSECWDTATGGRCQIVKVRRVNSVTEGVKEVTKYATKLTELPPQFVPTLHKVLSRKRRIRAFGAFAGHLEKNEAHEMTCPVCTGELILVPLLNLKPGNNFAEGNASDDKKVPQTAPIPPPGQLEFPDLAFTRSETYNFFN